MLLERINDEWLKGMLNGETGIFPSAFVSIEIDLPTMSQQSTDKSKESVSGKY